MEKMYRDLNFFPYRTALQQIIKSLKTHIVCHILLYTQQVINSITVQTVEVFFLNDHNNGRKTIKKYMYVFMPMTVLKRWKKSKEEIKVEEKEGAGEREHHEVRLLAIRELTCVRLLFHLPLNKK